MSAANIKQVYGCDYSTLLNIPRCTFIALQKASIEYLTGKTIEQLQAEDEPADDNTLENLGFPVIRS